jgi:lipoprotein-releasing system permease protein
MADSRKTGPFSPFEWMMALRYLRARRQEGFISVISGFSLLGIALGVATLIIVMSVMNGFRAELLKSILGLNGHVTVQAAAGNLADYDAVAARLRAVPGVVRAFPTVDGQVMASQNGVNSGALVRGIRKSDLQNTPIIAGKLAPGALAGFESGESLVIGRGLANKLGLRAGADITLIAPRGNVTPFGTTPRIKTYRVAATFHIGNTLYDNSFVFMPLSEAQLFFNTGDGVSGIETMVTDPEADIALLPALARAAGPDKRLVTWQDINSNFLEVLVVERNTMFLILSLIILVAALNIVSGLIMLVKDKSADVAILRTMGASRGAVMRIFFIAGASIGVIGTALGFALGVLFCAYIENIRQFLSRLTGTTLFDPTVYWLSRMPAQMDAGEVTSVVVMALVLTFLATLYPSWRAARFDPVEALRYG